MVSKHGHKIFPLSATIRKFKYLSKNMIKSKTHKIPNEKFILKTKFFFYFGDDNSKNVALENSTSPPKSFSTCYCRKKDLGRGIQIYAQLLFIF